MNQKTTNNLSQPAYEAATIKMAGGTPATRQQEEKLMLNKQFSYLSKLTEKCEHFPCPSGCEVVFGYQMIAQKGSN